jgi:hypothetical protein
MYIFYLGFIIDGNVFREQSCAQLVLDNQKLFNVGRCTVCRFPRWGTFRRSRFVRGLRACKGTREKNKEREQVLNTEVKRGPCVKSRL